MSILRASSAAMAVTARISVRALHGLEREQSLQPKTNCRASLPLPTSSPCSLSPNPQDWSLFHLLHLCRLPDRNRPCHSIHHGSHVFTLGLGDTEAVQSPRRDHSRDRRPHQKPSHFPQLARETRMDRVKTAPQIPRTIEKAQLDCRYPDGAGEIRRATNCVL